MSAVLDIPRHRFSRDQYERMVDAEIFGPNDRLELLDGELIEMSPQKSRHATAVSLVGEALRTVFGNQASIRTQLPFALDDRSEPEPDVAVIPGNLRDYRDAHPSKALLIVEVSDSSLVYDRGPKLAAYARAGIPEYWILNLEAQALEVFRRPVNGVYADQRVLQAHDRLQPSASAALDVVVKDLLP